MTPVLVMTAAALLLWAGAAVAGDGRLRSDVLWGTVGPLVAAGVTWLWIARAYAGAPGKLTAAMVTAGAFYAVFFGIYLAVVLEWTSVRSIPFVVSFTGAFVLFYGIEAFFLRRLLQQHGTPGS